jgi:hypothetical protein
MSEFITVSTTEKKVQQSWSTCRNKGSSSTGELILGQTEQFI